MPTLIHVTHEAVTKIGGIGTVLEGLITSPEYIRAIDRTILVCPLFSREGTVDDRLGPGGEVQYSSIDGRTHHPLAPAFQNIESEFGVAIVYGTRHLADPLTGREQRPEVILVDVGHAAPGPVNHLKGRFFEAFAIRSARYESTWDYEQYVRLALPSLAIVRALEAQRSESQCVIVSHEYMGMPTALAAKLHPEWRMKTVFYAHETATIRRIVEEHSGHDTMFYNVLRKCREEKLFLPDVFGDQFGYYRHALVEATRHLDVTFAVGDYVAEELRFLSPAMAKSDIRITYNGIPARKVEPDEAATSKRRLQEYANNLLGDRPQHIWTHVTRMSLSKGMWRDVNLMSALEACLRESNETAVLFVLSTELGGPRRADDILHMEQWWDWPVAHREGLPDLSDGEALFYSGVQSFNARARNSKIVYINQFGFTRQSCGERIPADMRFWDIRNGSDVEFGQSIYEPFGIAQLEALSFGAICVMSAVCGCAFFAKRAAEGNDSPNFLIADYRDFHTANDSIAEFQAITRGQREELDKGITSKIARELFKRLPRTAEHKSKLLAEGFRLANKMSWDVVARNYVLPVIAEICRR